jgi:hypothetical protein
MSAEVVALGGGILFVLVAIVGGGFTIRELMMPRVPNWARVTSAVFGLLLLLPFVLTVVNGQTEKGARSSSGLTPPREQRTGGIEIDTEPDTTPDGIRITGLAVTVRNDPPRVGDTVTVDYSLTNVGSQPIRMDSTFVGARDPADENRDSEDENENRVLGPGETIEAGGRVFLNGAGTWLIFPCYLLSGERYCPDEWKAFNVIVMSS